VAKNRKPPDKVFLNIPYDRNFENLFLAYIAGISAFGLVPRATLEIANSSRRHAQELDWEHAMIRAGVHNCIT
jgi:hypothetical protein